MKNLFILCFFLFSFTLSAQVGTTTQDSINMVAKSELLTTITIKSGKQYQTFKGSKGGMYIVRKSGKSGKYYKQYFKKD